MAAAQENINLSITGGQSHSNKFSTNSLYWLKSSLEPLLTSASTEFFGTDINAFLVALTKQPLPFWKENDYFVTQILIASNCTFQIRVSNTAAGIFLEESLGKRDDHERYFKFKNITRLEAEILSGYCEYIFKVFKNIFIEKRKIKKVKEFSKDLAHLTFLFNTPQRVKEDKPYGKFIVSFPAEILKEPEIPEVDYPVDLSKYYRTKSECNIYVGKATISLKDLKLLTANDILILDHSNLKRMEIFEGNLRIPFKVAPDLSLELNIHSEEYGEEEMTQDNLKAIKQGEAIWDNIQVEVAAEFKKIKLPLGELRNMTEGLVVEVASIADNEIRLNIDGEDLAIGELVIVGDKYGVMINKVLHKHFPEPEPQLPQQINNDDEDFTSPNAEAEDSDEDFNYDDLGLDDEF